jgi:hypothetical protein
MKIRKHYAVSLIEGHGESSSNVTIIVRISCETEEAEEFLQTVIDDILSKWYGHRTVQEDDVFYCDGSSPSVQCSSFKEVSENTFKEMLSIVKWFSRDIDDHRKKLLCK